MCAPPHGRPLTFVCCRGGRREEHHSPRHPSLRKMWITRALSYLFLGNLLTFQTAVLEANRNFIRVFEDESFTYRNDSYAYISKFKIFDKECDGCDALVQFFPGGYVSGTRYDHAPLMQYLSLSFEVEPWGIDYRLLDQGTSYDDIVSDVRAAMVFLRQHIGADRRIVVLGSSAGGDLAMRVGDLVDGLILDSAAFCLSSPTQFTSANSASAQSITSLILASSSYVCNPPPQSSTFVIHSEDDDVVLIADAKKYAQMYAQNVTSCFAKEGAHIVPFSDACVKAIDAWTQATFGWTRSGAARRSIASTLAQSYLLLGQANQALQKSMPEWFLDLFVRRCRSVSPVEAESNGCTLT